MFVFCMEHEKSTIDNKLSRQRLTNEFLTETGSGELLDVTQMWR